VTVDPPDGGVPFPFVVGVPRSGTTLLRLMLNAHPDLAIPPESYFITQLWARRERYAVRGGVDADLVLDDLLTDRAVDGSFRRHWGLDPALLRERLGGVRGDLSEVFRALFRLYADRMGKPRYGDKTPEYVLAVPLLAGLFPEAGFVHLVRDGRDVALSLVEQPWGPGTIGEAAEQWAVRVAKAATAGRALGAGRYLEVRYERLVAEPEAVLRTICTFLDLSFDPAMLAYRGTARRFVPPELQDHDRALWGPLRADLRDWRRQMSSSDVKTFEAIAGRHLRRLGYERGVRHPPLRLWLGVRGRRYVQALRARRFS